MHGEKGLEGPLTQTVTGRPVCFQTLVCVRVGVFEVVCVKQFGCVCMCVCVLTAVPSSGSRGHKERRPDVRADQEEAEPHRSLPLPAVHPATLPADAL